MSYVEKFVLNLDKTGTIMFSIIFFQFYFLVALAFGKFLDWKDNCYEPYKTSFAFFGGILAFSAFLVFLSM